MPYDPNASIYREVPGGLELVRWFGEVSSFHDAEIISLEFSRRGIRRLGVHGFLMSDKIDERGFGVHEKHAVVTFALEDIMDLQLDGFSPQNVIFGLQLQRATDRGRANYYCLAESPQDIEIELEPCYGLHGVIRAKRISISFEPGLPDGPSIYREGN